MAYFLGLVMYPLALLKLVPSIVKLPQYYRPTCYKPQWAPQHDAFTADIAGFILVFLVFSRMLLTSDPFWAIREPVPPAYLVHYRPPPAPDPAFIAHCNATFLQMLKDHNLLGDPPYANPELPDFLTDANPELPDLLPDANFDADPELPDFPFKFCPSIPPEPPPWADEGGFQWYNSLQWWKIPTTVIHTHPRYAVTIKPSKLDRLNHYFTTAIGFSVKENFEDTSAFDVDSKPFGIDPMASATISNNKDEFTHLRPLDKTYLAGVGGRVPVEGIGTLHWTIEDDTGFLHHIDVKDAYYCSEAPLRLLCPQQWASQRRNEVGPDHNTKFETFADFSRLTWSEFALTVPHEDKTNLPIWRTAPSYHKVAMNTQIDSSPNLEPTVVTDDEGSDDENESESEEAPKESKQVSFPFTDQCTRVHENNAETLNNDQVELLKLHNKYGHISFKLLKNMAIQGIIPKHLAHCTPPKCSSCLYGKQTKRPWRTKAKPAKIGGRMPNEAGQCVSVDQMISKTPGLIAQVKGWLTNKRYKAATVFADHASGLTYVHVSEGTTAEETLEAKAAFESYAETMGVTIKHYHADNGRFAENAFMENVKQSGQSISFCGVGAHHQNGVAERRIRDLTEHARTMLLHASHRWPKAINVHLWPYALRLAAHIRNHVPRESKGGAPIEIFSKAQVQNKIFHKHQHTFGCPVYVLDAPLQSGLSAKPKWSERSRIGAYLGHSSNHSQSVALVLNLKTGHVSPQFHVVFDDDFQTVDQDHNAESIWQEKANLEGNQSETILVDPDIHQRMKSPWYTTTPQQPHPTNPVSNDTDTSEQPAESNSTPEQQEPAPLRRSPRIAELLAKKASSDGSDMLAAHCSRILTSNIMEDGTINQSTPMALASSVTSGDPDTMHYGDARKQPDWNEFKKAMIKEVNDFDERGHWELVHIDQIDLSQPHDIISAIWSFKRKRSPTGELLKYKARLCAHGGQQTEGVTYWDTFAPVVNWHTLRTFLTLALIQKWKARSVDFVLAYPQADLTKDIYMRIPKGFNVSQPGNFLLKLKKNVYGLKDAGRTWHEHLKRGLLDRHFKQSLVDPCVFYRDNLILLIYVDDVICFCPEDKPIDDFIASMQKKEPQSFVLEDQGNLQDYLGIEIKEEMESGPNGDTRAIHITQPHLIAKILSTCGLDQDAVASRTVPAAPSVRLNKEGNPAQDPPFNYRSALGQLNYLAATSRPEIAFAVHQCARFCGDPREVHYKAVKRIAHYLHATKSKGITLRPHGTDIHCYADADFAGNYTSDASDDPGSVKSRSGFVILYAGCPIAWQSKLQTEIALSTTESEYISLSQATRSLLFLLELFKEIKQFGYDFVFPELQVYATCFEDNAGCLELAKAPKLRPRTKHIAVKYHHFRSHVYNKETNPEGSLHLKYVNTNHQLADMFTKGLSEATFERLRLAVCGW